MSRTSPWAAIDTVSPSRVRAATVTAPSGWPTRRARWAAPWQSSSDVQVPMQPKTTFTIGRIGGGTSVNLIPFEAWMEVDMRSSSREALAALDNEVSHRRRRGRGGGIPRRSRPGMISAVRSSSAIGPRARLRPRRPLSRRRWRWDAPLALHLCSPKGPPTRTFLSARKFLAITIGGGGSAADGHALLNSFRFDRLVEGHAERHPAGDRAGSGTMKSEVGV